MVYGDVWSGRHNLSGQYLIANNVITLNGVHQYPNFEWLNIVDPDKKYEDVYNRYAHISIILSDHTEFKLLGTDIYEAHLTYQNLKDLNVKYYYTNEQISEEQKKKFNLSVKYENKEKAQYIYTIN